MDKATSKVVARFGPINPFALGGAFIERAKELGWVEEDQDGRRRNIYITKRGQSEMKSWGVKLDTVRVFRPAAQIAVAAKPIKTNGKIVPKIAVRVAAGAASLKAQSPRSK